MISRTASLGIKEASGDLTQVMDIVSGKPDGFLVVSGDDSITLPMISAGADGVISVIGNAYPAQMSTMVASALDASFEKARELHYRLFPMMKAIFQEGNPSGVKASMNIQAWIENVLRLPLIPATKALHDKIARLDAALQQF
jgi:4-hydroxy-tetrahydrodipicolinate synthase